MTSGFKGRWDEWMDNDVVWSFIHSPIAWGSALLLGVLVVLAVGAPWIAPFDPFDLASIDIAAANLPPSWLPEGEAQYWLGADDQGRDLFSSMLYGTRLSLVIGLASVALSLVVGVGLGLVAGYLGGWVDSVIMRICDVMLSFPAILVALLVDGIARAVMPDNAHEDYACGVLIFAIALSGWVRYARTVRGLTMVEKKKEYVLASTLLGAGPFSIMTKHLLPNVVGPVFVLATVHIATAIMTEATLSFLGVGVPPTTPTLGSLIRIGNDYLFSGEWWVTIFPGLVLIAIVLSVNLLGDWLRDALNPRLK